MALYSNWQNIHITINVVETNRHLSREKIDSAFTKFPQINKTLSDII